MNRRVVVCVGIFLVALSLSISSPLYLGYKINEINQIISKTDELVKNENKEEAEKEMQKLIEKWQNCSPMLSTFLNHGSLEEIEIHLVSMKEDISQNQSEDYFVESKQATTRLTQIGELEKPWLHNIF